MHISNQFSFQNGMRFSLLALLVLLALASACSKDPAGPTPGGPNPEPPSDYPEIPQPTSPLDLDQPMQSDTFTLIVPIRDKQVDFAPIIADGLFSWDVDIQTHYMQRCLIGCPPGVTEIYLADPAGDYFNGTRRYSQMIFEGGVVDLRDLTPFPAGSLNGNTGTQRVLYIENGATVTPRNPFRNDCWFDFWTPDANKRVIPSLFAGSFVLPVEPGFFDEWKNRTYYAAAKSCDTLTAPVFVRRDRFWTRVLIDGKKSIRVDPGNTFSVSYEWTQGVAVSEAAEFGRTLDLDLALEFKGVTGSLGYTLSETFTTTVEVTEQTTVTTERTVTGIEGKTVIYSVWRSVEQYTITDSLGNPYTDPVFTFSDLGSSTIEGEYEWLSSAIFDQ